MQVRLEQPEYIEDIRRINVSAFNREDEANLVDRLRGVDDTFSLIAIESDRVFGHIFFSPVTISPSSCVGNDGDGDRDLLVLGLAPVAVLPNYQRQGIGSLLIQHSLEQLSRLAVKAIVVLGSPKYYPRFGFTPAKEKGLRCEYPVPDEVFMVRELEIGALDDCVGTVKYHSEFGKLST